MRVADYRAGFVGLVGLPNAGKSTLTNLLVGEKVSIVTAKAQTTRQRVSGVVTMEQGQIVLVDAPGVISADQTQGLNTYLQGELVDLIEESDALLLVLQRELLDLNAVRAMIDRVERAAKPWAVVVTKMDLKLGQPELQELMEGFRHRGIPVFELALLKLKANSPEVRALKLALLELLPESPAPLYDPELYTTQSQRQLAAELIREQCFSLLHQEIPYGIAVRVLRFIEDDGPVVKVYAEILVNKDNHKGIVVGKGADMVRRIGSQARQELEKILGRKVFLDLHVAVKKDWVKNPGIMKELGYVISTK